MKRCTKCKETKPVSFFSRNKSRHDGLAGECRACHKINHTNYRAKNREAILERQRLYVNKNRYAVNERKRRDYHKNPNAWHVYKLSKYGLTTEQYDAMVLQQKGRCLICKEIEKHRLRLSVDHAHDTNTVRGLLCIKCNAILGQVNDSPKLLRAAAEYLERHQ